MEHIFTIRAIVTANNEETDINISANGEISGIGKSFLLSDIIKALELNPDNPLDMAIIMVAISKCKKD